MTDVEAVLTTILCLAGLYILWLHVRLRRQNDKLQDATLAAAKAAVADQGGRPAQDEIRHLRERLHVLERIATDREHSLAREIDDLRDR